MDADDFLRKYDFYGMHRFFDLQQRDQIAEALRRPKLEAVPTARAEVAAPEGKGVCSVGYGSSQYLPIGGAWHFTWLPKGYGPSLDQIEIAVLADFDATADKYGLGKGERHPLAEAIAKAIQNYMRRDAAPGQGEKK